MESKSFGEKVADIIRNTTTIIPGPEGNYVQLKDHSAESAKQAIIELVKKLIPAHKSMSITNEIIEPESDEVFDFGWNECRQAILYKLK